MEKSLDLFYKKVSKEENEENSHNNINEADDRLNKEFMEQLDKLKLEKENLVQKYQISQVIKIYQRNGKPIYNEKNKYLDEEQEVNDRKREEIAAFKDKVAQFSDKFSDDLVLKNIKSNAFAEFMKHPIDFATSIKVKLPNGCAIEAEFKENQPLSDLFKLLNEHLIYNKDYFLCITPSSKIKYENNDISARYKKLKDLGMIPNIVLTLIYHDSKYNNLEFLIVPQEQKSLLI